MKTLYITYFLIFVLISTVILPCLSENNQIDFNISKPLPDDEVDQVQLDQYGYYTFSGSTWLCQGFTPTLNILTRVELKWYKNGSPPEDLNITASIRKEKNDIDLTKTTIKSSVITESKWIEFDFPDIPVLAGEMYYIVCRMDRYSDNDFENCVAWRFDINDPYDGGEAWYSVNYGNLWRITSSETYPLKDFCFKTYGRNNSPPHNPIVSYNKDEGHLTVVATDPDENMIRYGVDWDEDQIIDEWTELVSSGDEQSIDCKGRRGAVNVVAEDEYGFRSEWVNIKSKHLKPLEAYFVDVHTGIDELLDQQQIEQYSSHGDSEMTAQSFTPTLPILTKIELLLKKRYNQETGNLHLSVRSSLDSYDLASIWLDSSEIGTVMDWYTFDIDDIPLVPGDTYYIVWKQFGFGDDEDKNWLYWGYGIENPYLNGTAWEMDNGVWHIHHGGSNDDYDMDFCFKTYGKHNAPPTTPICSYNRDEDMLIMVATDPNENMMRYGVDWDSNGVVDQWTDMVSSGTEMTVECNDKEGTVGIIAEDEYGAQSEWVSIESEKDHEISLYLLMRPDGKTLQKWQKEYTNAEKAYTDPKLQSVIEQTDDYSILDLLKYEPSERDQHWCSNCWAWPATGVMAIALHVQEDIYDRLSVQYINSCGSKVGVGCCEGGNLNLFARFYRLTHKAIPWSNENAEWIDRFAQCNTPCESIATEPNYPISTIRAEKIETHEIPVETAIENIKNVLHQEKGVYFSWYLTDMNYRNDFSSFWSDDDNETIYALDWDCGATFDEEEGGGHAVLCVGYHDEEGTENDYWIMLNSWGTTFQRPKGLFRITMHMDYDCTFFYQDQELYTFNFQTLNISFGDDYKAPPPPLIEGTTSGDINTHYFYEFTANDPQGDDVYLSIDWGDGEIEEWIGAFASGEPYETTHSWRRSGSYQIRAKAKDDQGNEGSWATLEVSMPKSKPQLSLLEEQFPQLYSLLYSILNT